MGGGVVGKQAHPSVRQHSAKLLASNPLTVKGRRTRALEFNLLRRPRSSRHVPQDFPEHLQSQFQNNCLYEVLRKPWCWMANGVERFLNTLKYFVNLACLSTLSFNGITSPASTSLPVQEPYKIKSGGIRLIVASLVLLCKL